MPNERAGEYLSETGLWFRLMLVWITFPPMLLLTFGQPVLLVVVYAALGAFFMPFMAFTLLWLLNWRVDREYRNGWLSNALLVAAILLFVVVGVQEVAGAL